MSKYPQCAISNKKITHVISDIPQCENHTHVNKYVPQCEFFIMNLKITRVKECFTQCYYYSYWN